MYLFIYLFYISIVSTCWGIENHKDYIDGEVIVTFNEGSFQAYMSGDVHNIVQDMKELCTYVNNNRIYLNIHPDWNINTVSNNNIVYVCVCLYIYI